MHCQNFLAKERYCKDNVFMHLHLDRTAVSGLQDKKQQCEYTQHYWIVCLHNGEDGKFYIVCFLPS